MIQNKVDKCNPSDVRKRVMQQTVDALREFTARYCDAWQQRTGHAPASQALYGVPSPCIIATQDRKSVV